MLSIVVLLLRHCWKKKKSNCHTEEIKSLIKRIFKTYLNRCVWAWWSNNPTRLATLKHVLITLTGLVSSCNILHIRWKKHHYWIGIYPWQIIKHSLNTLHLTELFCKAKTCNFILVISLISGLDASCCLLTLSMEPPAGFCSVTRKCYFIQFYNEKRQRRKKENMEPHVGRCAKNMVSVLQ